MTTKIIIKKTTKMTTKTTATAVPNTTATAVPNTTATAVPNTTATATPNIAKPYTAISLFSGLGGDSLGLKQAGCNVIAYNEFKKKFCESHTANFPDCELICDGDVNDISKLKDDIFEKYKDKTDIVFAGFPCQGFSNAGKKKENDPRNTLFREFLRVVQLLQPSMIIGENVKGLLSRKTEANELYIDVIVQEFEKIGYDVKFQVFKTDQYNVPQKRERLIILGTKKNNAYGWTTAFPEPLKHLKPNLKEIVKYSMVGTVRVNPEWFENIPKECIITNMSDDEKYTENNKGHPYLLSKINADIETRTYAGKHYDNLFSFGKRISPIHCEIVDIRQASKTIICSYDHQPRFFVPIQNKSGYYLRMLLPDELKQIQGFPFDHIVRGNIKEQIVQIGNAVPPPLIKSIVKHVIM
jgi:DNA (cytosine-5)-methyltransferase 1